jgi:aspartyl-tRNA(Asn)/glutamyl-tRNA(Gln) amidotransferase subunit C
MDAKTFDHLCTLSKLSFTDEEKEAVIRQMNDITALMDTVRGNALEYDDTKDGTEIRFDSLREDVPQPSFTAEELLANTNPRNNCYVIPKMMEG